MTLTDEDLRHVRRIDQDGSVELPVPEHTLEEIGRLAVVAAAYLNTPIQTSWIATGYRLEKVT